MRVIIAGSRDIKGANSKVRIAMLSCPFIPTVIISGTARGVDQAGENWAESVRLDVERYPADWETHGKSAGYKRNQLMAEKADALVAIWDGKSRGRVHQSSNVIK